MTSRKPSLVALFSICFFLFPGSSFAQSVGQLFTVTSIADSDDKNVGDGLCADSNGRCTLRAAVQEANSDGHTRDVIVFGLSYPAVIDLTIGEIPITSNLAIVGPGARRLTIGRSTLAGGPEFGIFNVAKGVGDAQVRGITIRDGASEGGAFFVNEAARLTITESFVFRNSGCAIVNFGGVVNINRSLLTSNVGTSGGALWNATAGSAATVINSTFTQNSAAYAGGAIYNQGDLLLVNDTFSNNTGLTRCHSLCSETTVPSARVLNTVFGFDADLDRYSLFGSFVSLGNNIISKPGPAIGFENGVNNDQVGDGQGGNLDPLLGPLSDNGGQTDTMALLTGSPAIDHGNNCVINGTCSITPSVRFRTDQRGQARVFSTVDVGAYEYVPGTTGTSFGLFVIRPIQPARFLGSVVILTDPTDNAKRYFPMNAFGSYHLPTLSGGTYILEIKTKRLGLGSDPVIISSSDFPPSSFTLHFQGFDVQVTSELDKKK